MRLFALLLSLYVLCLSCMPCTDEVRVCVEQGQTSMRTAEHSDFGKHASDACSPLCQCHCCPGAVVVSLEARSLGLTPPAPSWFTDLRHAPLLIGIPTHAAGDVWQPPQA